MTGKMFKKVDKGEIAFSKKSNEKSSHHIDEKSNEKSRVNRENELELLAKKNPSLARFVSLGRFAQVSLCVVCVCVGGVSCFIIIISVSLFVHSVVFCFALKFLSFLPRI